MKLAFSNGGVKPSGMINRKAHQTKNSENKAAFQTNIETNDKKETRINRLIQSQPLNLSCLFH